MLPDILYVEDNPAEVFLLAEAVRKVDPTLKLKSVSDGESALAFLSAATDQPCVIVLDLGLPKIDGAEVFKAVKSNPAFNAVPTIVFASPAARRKIETTGYAPDLFLTKPMDLDGYADIAAQIVALCTAGLVKATA